VKDVGFKDYFGEILVLNFHVFKILRIFVNF
jgi:hypothetical protein